MGDFLRRIRPLKMYGTFRWSKVKWEFCHICGSKAPMRKNGTLGAHNATASPFSNPCEGIGKFPRSRDCSHCDDYNYKQGAVDLCGCTLIWDGQELVIYLCIQNLASRMPSVLVDEGGALMEVAI